MQTYTERARQIVHTADVAVMVCLNVDNTDMEFWALWPRQAAGRLTTPAEFKARKLRTVGVIGICAGSGIVAFKEALPEDVVARLGTAFGVYVRTLLDIGQPDIVQPEEKGDEVEWLCKLWSLSDPRTN